MVIGGIINLLLQLIRLYQLALVFYALMTWFPSAVGTPLWRAVSRIVEPYLEIFDRYIPSIGGISFNVMIAIFVLQLVQQGIVTLAQLLLY